MNVDVITGCDSGIGYYLVKKYIEMGLPVIYSFLEKDEFAHIDNCYGFKLDLRSELSIESFVKSVEGLILEKDFNINVLFNNSGIALGGPVENLPLYIYREVMEVNYFGLISVIQKIIPNLLKSKGKIVIHGSMAGRIALPYMSAYAASKYALEALADCLRRELYRDGIQVSLLETGGVATPIWNKAEKQDISFVDSRYKNSVDAFYKKFVKPAQKSLPVERAANSIYKLFKKKKLPHRFRVSKNSLINYLPILLPTCLKDYLFRKLVDLNK